MSFHLTLAHLDGFKCYFFQKQFFDQDGSGAIDTRELGNIMRQLGAKLSDAEIDLLVKEADVDGDGQVDINEASLSPVIQVQLFRTWHSSHVPLVHDSFFFFLKIGTRGFCSG